MSAYAKGTSVTPEKSRQEIEDTLKRFGVDGFMYGDDGGKAMIQFRTSERFVRFIMTLPRPKDVSHTETGKRRTKKQAEAAYEKELRRKWRALLISIKGKLVSVEEGVETFEEAFLAHIVVATGSGQGVRVSEWLTPQLEANYATGTLPALLPGSDIEGD